MGFDWIFIGDVGWASGAETIAEDTEEWEDSDDVLFGDWWDSKQSLIAAQFSGIGFLSIPIA